MEKVLSMIPIYLTLVLSHLENFTDDKEKYNWDILKTSGVPPSPRGYHTACVIEDKYDLFRLFQIYGDPESLCTEEVMVKNVSQIYTRLIWVLKLVKNLGNLNYYIRGLNSNLAKTFTQQLNTFI
jgi:hypothetical protein